jgi:hypothetical protein
MDTIPEDELRRLRLVMRALAVGSAAVHCALCVYCLVKHVQAPSPSPHLFALHHTRVSSQLTNATNATNATCPAPTFALERVGHSIDGLVLLAVVFFGSCAAQCFYAYTTFREQALETFRQPCLPRWLEYALTSPLQVVLVALCLLIRDVQTLALLAAAQAASLLLGFAVEFALGAADLEDPIEHTILARSPPSLAVPCELRIGTLVCGPNVDERYYLTHEHRAARAFQLSFAVSSLLHAAVWAVLLSQLLAVEASVCAQTPQPWTAPLRLVATGHCALFSSLKLVPLLQSLWMWAGEADASTVFLYGSVAYAVLSVVAQSLLLASYVTFVELSPFA